MTLTAHDLHFAYNGRPVLRGMGLALRRGESLGILGVNGAGKSTLLKCLNRILSPQQGVVMLGERDLARSDPTQVARMLGYVPQRASSEQLSVFDAVLLGRKPHIKWQASGHDLEVVARVLERMGLTDLGLRPVSALSGGEAQKVVIARAPGPGAATAAVGRAHQQPGHAQPAGGDGAVDERGARSGHRRRGVPARYQPGPALPGPAGAAQAGPRPRQPRARGTHPGG